MESKGGRLKITFAGPRGGQVLVQTRCGDCGHFYKGMGECPNCAEEMIEEYKRFFQQYRSSLWNIFLISLQSLISIAGNVVLVLTEPSTILRTVWLVELIFRTGLCLTIWVWFIRKPLEEDFFNLSRLELTAHYIIMSAYLSMASYQFFS